MDDEESNFLQGVEAQRLEARQRKEKWEEEELRGFALARANQTGAWCNKCHLGVPVYRALVYTAAMVSAACVLLAVGGFCWGRRVLAQVCFFFVVCVVCCCRLEARRKASRLASVFKAAVGRPGDRALTRRADVRAVACASVPFFLTTDQERVLSKKASSVYNAVRRLTKEHRCAVEPCHVLCCRNQAQE